VEALKFANTDGLSTVVNNVEALEFVNMEREKPSVSNVEALKFANTDGLSTFVNNVEALEFVFIKGLNQTAWNARDHRFVHT
jgi:hypothetical protein